MSNGKGRRSILSNRGKIHAAASAIFLLIAVLQYPQIFTGRIVWGENVVEYLPWHVEAARQIREGIFPFFTERAFGGMPLFSAAYTGVLYPPNLLYVIFSPLVSNWLMCFHIFIAAYGMFCYLFAKRLRVVACFISAVLFQCSTFFLLHYGHVSMFEAAAWSPWIVLAVHRLLRRPDFRNVIICSLVIALQLTVGYWQMTLIILPWIALEWAMHRDGDRAELNRKTMLLLLAGALAVGLLAIQILPAVYHTQQTPRAEMSVEDWYRDSFPPAELAAGLNPRAFGLGKNWQGLGIDGESVMTISPIGWVLAVGAFMGSFSRRIRISPTHRRLVRITAAMLILAFVLACGKFVPHYDLLFYIPPFSLFRVPARWLFMVDVCGVILCAVMIHYGLRMSLRERFLIVAASLAALLIAAVAIAPAGASRLGLFFQLGQPVMHRVATHLPFAIGDLFDRKGCHVAFLLIAACAFVFAAGRWKVFAPIMVLLVMAEWGVLRLHGVAEAGNYPATMNRSQHPFFSSPQSTDYQRIYSISANDEGDMPSEIGIPGNTNLFLDVPSIGGYTPLYSLRLRQVLSIGQNGVGWYDPVYYANPEYLKIVGVTHLLIDRRRLDRYREETLAASLGNIYDVVAEHAGLQLLALRNPLPRFGFADRWVPMEGLLTDFDVFLWSDPAHFTVGKYATRLEMIDQIGKMPGKGKTLMPGTIEVLKDDPSHQKLRVTAPEKSIVLIRDVFWKGWEYRIGENSAAQWHPVGRADGVIRWLPVPAGNSIVELRFIPPGFKLGAAISAMTFMSVLAGFVCVWISQRRKSISK